jgi:hypothetical protein
MADGLGERQSGAEMFEAPIAIGSDSDMQSKLLARLGRNPGWQPPN